MESHAHSYAGTALWLLAAGILVAAPAAQQAPTIEQAKLTASDGASDDEFGTAVAIDGNTILVGAPFDDDGASDAGTAFVYVRAGNTWSEQQKLVGSLVNVSNVAGTSVALQGDTAVVGAPQLNLADGGYINAGIAFIHTRLAGNWSELQWITASDAESGDEFGQSLALDGSRLAVGAPREDGSGILGPAPGPGPGSGYDRGAVYVFGFNGSSWGEQFKLEASYGSDYDLFGASIAIEGGRLAIGAPNESGRGAVYVFDYDGYGWSETQTFTGSDTTTSDEFGASVALSGDTILVGAPGHGSGEGAVYAFTRVGLTWTEQQKLLPDVDGPSLPQFGEDTALDGDTAVIGARFDGMGGTTYIFERAGGSWARQARIESADVALADNFGRSVAFDGTSVVVGASRDDDNGSDSGSAYVFVAPPEGSTDIIAMDADGDGSPDVLTTTLTNDLRLRLNDGMGAFAAPTPIALTVADLSPVALVAGDFDNNPATADVAVACEASNTVAIVTDIGNSPIRVSMNVGSGETSCIAAGDIDTSDLTDDIVYGRRNSPFGSDGGVGYIDNASGPNEITIPVGVARSIVAVAVADLDGDGDEDVVALGQSGAGDEVLLIQNDGFGVLTYSSAFSLGSAGSARGLCVTDVDRDGDLDIIVAIPTLFPTPSTELRCLFYSGSGVFGDDEYSSGAGLPTSGTFVVDIDCGDVDCDSAPGVVDATDVVLTAIGSGDVELLIGYDPSVPSAGATQSVTAPTQPIAAVVADLNGDNVDDIVVASQISNDIEVTLNTAPCSVAIGTGCPGTGGIVPTLSEIGSATQGNAAFGAALRNARPFAPAVFLLGFAQTNIPLPYSSCTLYLDGPLATVARFCDGFGSYDYVFGVPASTPVGLDAYFQYAVFDPAGSFANTIAMTNALRVVIQPGNP